MPEFRRRLASVSLSLAAWIAAGVVLGVLGLMLVDVFTQGAKHVSWSFLTSAPEQMGRQGGIGPVLVSTAGILIVCFGSSLPLGVATAMLLAEYASENKLFGRWIRRSLDMLAGVPSVVFGLFGNAFFCQTLGLGVSILSGGLTLACMVLPFLIRASEQAFRAVPNTHRQTAAALGFSKPSTLFHIVLPLATPGIAVGLVLGMGRALAETAALLFTSGYVPRMPQSVFDSGRMLSVHIYDLAMNIPDGNQAAYGSAVVLVAMLLGINGLAHVSLRFLLRGKVITTPQ